MIHALAGALLLGLAGSEDAAVTAAAHHRDANGTSILAELRELLAIPCVASDLRDVRATAEHVSAMLARRGVATRLLELEGAPPVVYGRLDAPGATRTLGIYVHYDGQPVDPAKWSTPGPWTPTLYTGAIEAGGEPRAFPAAGEAIDPEWRLYARAAGDDKAPIVALTAALDALGAAGLARTSNLIFFFEGEEEAGSPHLGEYMDRHAEVLRADAWLVCDGPVHPSRRPQLVFGVRGITALEITVYGAARSLHSGHYGNWAPNPAMRLAQLLATMKNDRGEVLVEGFYEGVEPLGDEERAALAAIPDLDDELAAELGIAESEGTGSLAERLLLPSLNVRGLASANVGASARNVIPSEAVAAIDIRLVRGNDPAHMLDLVEEHVRRQGYHVVREKPDAETRRAHPRLAKIERHVGYRAARTAMDAPIGSQVAAACERAAGEAPILVPSLGGSLPLYLFEEKLGAPLVIVPIANHDDGQHAPDENLRIANLWYGTDLFAAILTMP